MLYPDFNDLVALKGRKLNLHPSRRSVKSTVSGNHHSPFRGQGLEFDSVREYVPGDDIRNIDWRVTARTGLPHLKVFKEDRERHIVLCVDMNAAMRFGTRNTFKSIQAAHTAALLGWQAIAQHDRVSTYLFGDVPQGIQFFAPQRTRKSFCSVLQMLSTAPSESHHISSEMVLQQISRTAHAGALIYLISDFMNLGKNFQHDSCLKHLSKKCDLIFIAINDPADKSLLPIGTLGFCANDKEKIFVDTDNIAGRTTYAAQWNENRQQLYDIGSKFRIPTLELSTESDIHKDLLMGLKAIGKRKRY